MLMKNVKVSLEKRWKAALKDAPGGQGAVDQRKSVKG